jgi:hypothetical protein
MELKIEITTAKASMTELRPLLDAAFQKEFPGGMLQRKWNGDVLELSGPGASGTIVLESGRIVGQATLRPPASLMRGMIESKVASVLKAVG